MPITIAGSGTITGISAGGLPDASVVTADIADANITAAKLSGAQSGSAPIYGARAFVNFNGTGVVAIRASGNVSSITDNGTGNYTVNFTTAMPDADYSVVTCADNTNASFLRLNNNDAVPTTSAVRISSINTSFAPADILFANVAIFR